MKTDTLKHAIETMFEHDMEMMVAKNHDYASENDALENFRDWGLAGFGVRIGDKYKRVKNIIQKGKSAVAGEPLTDAFRDLAVYCYLARVFMIERKDPSDMSAEEIAKEIEEIEMSEEFNLKDLLTFLTMHCGQFKPGQKSFRAYKQIDQIIKEYPYLKEK